MLFALKLGQEVSNQTARFHLHALHRGGCSTPHCPTAQQPGKVYRVGVIFSFGPSLGDVRVQLTPQYVRAYVA